MSLEGIEIKADADAYLKDLRPAPVITISPTVQLVPGGVYVIEITQPMPATAMNNLRAILTDEEPRLGVKLLLLPHGARVATVQVIADDIDDAA